MFWSYKGDLVTAAHIWAAAAGTARAIAPRHIVNALMEGHELVYAAIEGTKRADAEVDEDWPAPRGCEILVERGVISLQWRTERHRILLSEASEGKWDVTIHCHHHGGSECERIQVAKAAQRLWEKHGKVLQKASSSTRHRLNRAVTMVTRMSAQEEISPDDLDIASPRGLHAIWGVFWAWEDYEALHFVESILGYFPRINAPAGEDSAGIVIDTLLGDPNPVTLRPTGTMAVILRGRLMELGRPEFDPVIYALGVVAGVEY